MTAEDWYFEDGSNWEEEDLQSDEEDTYDDYAED